MRYTDKQLLNRVKSLPSYDPKRGLPKQLLIGVRNKAGKPNQFSDKFYLYIDENFVLASTGTTISGTPSLLGGWTKTNKKGTAVIKSDEIYYDSHKKSDGKKVRHHKDKMPCLRQVGKMKYYRDNNNNDIVEEYGEVYYDNYATNVHFNNYDIFNKVKRLIIGNWSEGCPVLNESEKYVKMLKSVDNDDFVSLAILNEF